MVFTKTNGIAPASPTLTTLYIDKYFEVRENDAPTKYVWNGNTRVARMTGSATNSLVVQRLRVFPGQNLVSLTVTAPNALQQLANSQPSTLNPQLCAKWDPPSQTWLPVVANKTLPAGTVLWLSAATKAMVRLDGIAGPTINTAIPLGPSYQPAGPLLASFSASVLPNDLMAAKFDPTAQGWQTKFATPLQAQSASSLSFSPNDGLFIRAGSPVPLSTNGPAMGIRYYHHDHLGSTSVLSDAAGQLAEESAYFAFGQPRTDFKPMGVRENYRFTQKEADLESGLAYYEARYMAPPIARFSSWDPALCQCHQVDQPSRLNPYCYADNNPVKFFDPSGQGALQATLVLIATEVGIPFVKVAGGPIGYKIGQGLDYANKLAPAIVDYLAAREDYKNAQKVTDPVQSDIPQASSRKANDGRRRGRL